MSKVLQRASTQLLHPFTQFLHPFTQFLHAPTPFAARIAGGACFPLFSQRFATRLRTVLTLDDAAHRARRGVSRRQHTPAISALEIAVTERQMLAAALRHRTRPRAGRRAALQQTGRVGRSRSARGKAAAAART